MLKSGLFLNPSPSLITEPIRLGLLIPGPGIPQVRRGAGGPLTGMGCGAWRPHSFTFGVGWVGETS